MNPDAKALLTNVRQGLLRLRETPLDWQRGHYERTHGRQSTADLLNTLAQGVLAQLKALTSPGDSGEGDARRDRRASP